MGLAYTIDTPVKVARYGIDSVVSIIEDKLIELMRKYYYAQYNLPYQPISSKEDDYRAKRITDYLNLLNTIVQQQFDRLKNTAVAAGTEITKYLEMLPGNSPLRQAYERVLTSDSQHEKDALTALLSRNASERGRVSDYIRLGTYSAKMGNADEAQQALLTAAKIDGGKNIWPQRALADFYGSVGDIERQVKRLRMAYAIDPNNRETLDEIRRIGEIPGPTFALTPTE